MRLTPLVLSSYSKSWLLDMRIIGLKHPSHWQNVSPLLKFRTNSSKWTTGTFGCTHIIILAGRWYCITWIFLLVLMWWVSSSTFGHRGSIYALLPFHTKKHFGTFISGKVKQFSVRKFILYPYSVDYLHSLPYGTIRLPRAMSWFAITHYMAHLFAIWFYCM